MARHRPQSATEARPELRPAVDTGALVLVADSGRARLFESGSSSQELRELMALTNPEARLPERELVTDAPGRQALGRTASGHSAYGGDRAKRHRIETFAGVLCERLRSALMHWRTRKVYVVAPPEFLGLLRMRMDSVIQGQLAGELPRALATRSAREIRQALPRRL